VVQQVLRAVHPVVLAPVAHRRAALLAPPLAALPALAPARMMSHRHRRHKRQESQ
jgi:hypothetical protein